MNDADFLLDVLSDGREHTTGEILAYSQQERGCGLTVHSRAAELRKRGHVLATRCIGRPKGRAVWAYRLVERSDVTHVASDRGANVAPSLLIPPVDGGGVHASPPSAEQLALALPGASFRKDVAA